MYYTDALAWISDAQVRPDGQKCVGMGERNAWEDHAVNSAVIGEQCRDFMVTDTLALSGLVRLLSLAKQLNMMSLPETRNPRDINHQASGALGQEPRLPLCALGRPS